MTTAKGWAVIKHGLIDMKTVADTRRAAIVNWLYLEGTMVYRWTTDDEIDDMWERAVSWARELHAEISVEEVTVTRQQP